MVFLSKSCFLVPGSSLASALFWWLPFPGGWGTLDRRGRSIFTMRDWGVGESLTGESNFFSLIGKGSFSLWKSSLATMAGLWPLVLLGVVPWPWGRGLRVRRSWALPSKTSLMSLGSKKGLALAWWELLCFLFSGDSCSAGFRSFLSLDFGFPFVLTFGLSLEDWSLTSKGPGSLSTFRLPLGPSCTGALPGLLIPTVCLGEGSLAQTGDFWQLRLVGRWASWGALATRPELLWWGSLSSVRWWEELLLMPCPCSLPSSHPFPWAISLRLSVGTAGGFTLVSQLSSCHLLEVGGSGCRQKEKEGCKTDALMGYFHPSRAYQNPVKFPLTVKRAWKTMRQWGCSSMCTSTLTSETQASFLHRIKYVAQHSWISASLTCHSVRDQSTWKLHLGLPLTNIVAQTDNIGKKAAIVKTG